MFNEREAIRQELEFNRQERLEANRRYWDERTFLRTRQEQLMDRLKELDREDKGIIVKHETSIESHREMMRNKSIQEVAASSIMEYEIEDKVKEKTVFQSIDEVVDQQNEDDNGIKKRQNKDLKKIGKIVLSYLKEKGVPVKAETIFKYLDDDHEIVWSKNNRGTALKAIMEYEPKIQKAHFGHYQYKF